MQGSGMGLLTSQRVVSRSQTAFFFFSRPQEKEKKAVWLRETSQRELLRYLEIKILLMHQQLQL